MKKITILCTVPMVEAIELASAMMTSAVPTHINWEKKYYRFLLNGTWYVRYFTI